MMQIWNDSGQDAKNYVKSKLNVSCVWLYKSRVKDNACIIELIYVEVLDEVKLY